MHHSTGGSGRIMGKFNFTLNLIPLWHGEGALSLVLLLNNASSHRLQEQNSWWTGWCNYVCKCETKFKRRKGGDIDSVLCISSSQWCRSVTANITQGWPVAAQWCCHWWGRAGRQRGGVIFIFFLLNRAFSSRKDPKTILKWHPGNDSVKQLERESSSCSLTGVLPLQLNSVP